VKNSRRVRIHDSFHLELDEYRRVGKKKKYNFSLGGTQRTNFLDSAKATRDNELGGGGGLNGGLNVSWERLKPLHLKKARSSKISITGQKKM